MTLAIMRMDNCHPRWTVPLDGLYARVDDDETGTCYSTDEIDIIADNWCHSTRRGRL